MWEYQGTFLIILSISQNIGMDLNNVMNEREEEGKKPRLGGEEEEKKTKTKPKNKQTNKQTNKLRN